MKEVLAAYWPSVYKHRWLALGMMLLMVMTLLNKTAYPFLLRNIMQGLMDGSDRAVTYGLWLVIAMLVFMQGLWYLYDRVIVFFELRIMRDLSRRSFAAVQSQSMRFFENSFTGSLVTAAKRFRSSFEHITDAVAYQLGRSAVLMILTLGIFAWEYPMLALAFTIWAVTFCGVSYWIAKKRVERDASAAEKDSKVSGAFADSFSNQPTVRSFGKEREEQQRFDDVTEDCYREHRQAWLFGIRIIRIQGATYLLFEVAVVALLIQGWKHGTVTAGDFLFFQSYVLILMQQLWDIGNTLHKVFRNVAEAKEMAEIFFQESEVQDIKGARPLNMEQGTIEFHAVNFRYNPEADYVVNSFTLSVASGESVALVGKSGAGKSTLVKLLMRGYDVNSGYIRIDGQDIADVTQCSLRQQVALVPQQPDLFHRTLRENIAFAQPDASEAEIIAAAKRAHTWEFINKLPQKLETLVGERGIKLSGGERQRIALARAFLVDTKILLLDEATSSLDSETEHQIQSAIADLMERRTCIIIAHRLSTIRRVDRIIVMHQGSIVEQGNHHELLARKGIYDRLWARQSGGYICE